MRGVPKAAKSQRHVPKTLQLWQRARCARRRQERSLRIRAPGHGGAVCPGRNSRDDRCTQSLKLQSTAIRSGSGVSSMTRVAFTHGDPFLPVPFVACDIRDGPRGAPLACAIQWITSWMWPSSNIVQEMPVTRVLTLYLLDWDCIASFSVSALY